MTVCLYSIIFIYHAKFLAMFRSDLLFLPCNTWVCPCIFCWAGYIVLDLSAAQYAMFHPELISMDYVSMMSRTHKKPKYFFWNCGEQYFLGNWRGGGISPKNRSKSKNDEKQDRRNVFKWCSSFNILIDFKHILVLNPMVPTAFWKNVPKVHFWAPGVKMGVK